MGEQTSASQRRVQRLSRFVGRPIYLAGIVTFVAVWIVSNMEAPYLGWPQFDPPPFSVLQGLTTLLSLVTTTIVLIAQNRQTKLELQHSQLDLQVNLLTEQKVTKLMDYCKGMHGLMKEATKHITKHAPEEGELLDLVIIAQYQRMSHYGLAGFGTAAAYAKTLGLSDHNDNFSHRNRHI